MPEEKMKTSRAIVYCILVVLGFFVGAELCLRAVGFRYQRNLSYLQFGYPNQVELHQVFELDPKLIFRMKPGYDFGEGFEPLNRQGFRGKDFIAQKPLGVLRIACLGDSVTFGSAEGSYPALLEQILNKKAGEKKFQVYNFGVPGYTSYQGRWLFEEVLEKYHPDLAVVFYGWNDHWLAKGFTDSEQKVEVEEGGLIQLRNALAHLRLYQFLNWLIAHLNSAIFPKKEKFRVPIEEYDKNLKEMIQLARAHNCQLILATSPAGFGLAPLPDYLEYLGFIKKGEDLAQLHERYNQVVRKVAKAENVPLVDLDLIFRSQGVKNFFQNPEKDIIHPNRKGMELIANSVAGKIFQVLSSANKEGGQ